MINKSSLECYRAAGIILHSVLTDIRSHITPESRLLEIAELVESMIIDRGGLLAFPCNISLDNIAAHYTPSATEESSIGKSVVKIDAGCHVNGFIADSAITVDLTEKHNSLVMASEEALRAAIDIIKPGINTREIGKVISDVITGYGYKPIRNLTGHGLARYNLHSSVKIPNVPDYPVNGIIREGAVIAIEPFATTGTGIVRALNKCEIYSLRNAKSLPFSKRRGGLGPIGYPILAEDEGVFISQAEHSVIVSKHGCEVFT